MKTSTFNRIFENARSVNIQSNEWFNYAGFFWMQCTEKQLEKMRMLLKAQGCKTTVKNGERGEACAMILVEDAQAWALQSAFSGKDNTKAGYFLRERGIGFCWSCEHLRGRSYVENSIKSVEVKEA